MSTRWYQERRRDHFFNQAKKEGYRARSAYKLKQLNKKFHIVKKGGVAVDLGAAPGGWSQVLLEMVGPEGVVIGVDLKRIVPIEGVTFLQGDFTRRATHEDLHDIIVAKQKSMVDCVVSDMAPDMTGSYVVDQARSVHLCEMALRFALTHLRRGGHFACKIFEGEDYQEFRNMLRKYFSKVMQASPEASRNASSEIYLIAKGFKPTAELDELREELWGGNPDEEE